MTKEELDRLINLERKGMAETEMRNAQERIRELSSEIYLEQGKYARAKDKLDEAMMYLRSIGEVVE